MDSEYFCALSLLRIPFDVDVVKKVVKFAIGERRGEMRM
jgi:hypothetical protein